MRDGQQLSRLPSEIIAIILLWLPIKSILQYRSVCKEWLSIISDSTFVKSQVKWAQEKPNLALKRHIVFHKLPPNATYPPEVSSIGFKSLDRVEHTWPFENSYEDAEILASCNGLLLVGTGEQECFLWNPNTRVHKKLKWERSHFRQFVRLYGLGYDSVSETHKVLRIVRVTSIRNPELISTSPYHNYDSTNVHVYNATTGSWRMIKDEFPYKVFSNRKGIFVKGGLYLIVIREDRRILKHVIVCFDLVKEKFMEIESPRWLGERCDCTSRLLQECKFDLVDLNGSLCLIQFTTQESQMWMLNEDGAMKFWTKFMVIPNIRVQKILPLCCTDDEIVMLVEDRWNNVVLYNIKNGTSNEIFRFTDRPVDVRCVFSTAQYTETLASP